MLQIHVLLDEAKSWIDYVPPLVTALAALGTVVVAVRISNNQNSLQRILAERQLDMQERQLKKDLFDRRFTIFTETLDFIGLVLRNDGDIVLEGEEYRHFRQTMLKAGMLFGADVRNYLKGLDETARELYVSAKGRVQAVASGDVAAINKHGELLTRISELAPVAEDVFRPYLSL